MSYIGSKPADAVLETDDIADGVITTSKLADDSVTNPKLFTGSQQNFRNIIINGDMSIAQRGTSATSVTSAQYLVDRHYFNLSNLGTWTISQDTDVPTGQGFAKSLKLDCTTADASPVSSDFLILQHRIEGQNLQYLKKGTANAESLTASFWVKSNKTGTFICELFDNDNNRTISQAYTISSANTWEKKTITFDGDTTGTLNNDNNRSFELALFFGAGSDRTSGTLQTSWGSLTQANRAVGQVNLADSTSNYINITGVQLEAGTSASDFEFLPYDVNLRRCLRYYYIHEPTTAFYAPYASNDAYNVYWTNFPVPMRATPTLTETSSRGWGMGNATKYTFAGYRLPAGNYTPPDYNADAEL